MDKRFQVFVSSTFTDLQTERQKVFQALMELDCIPAGMELFPAMDEEQFEFIKKIIDDSDYYILIIGGRYGSTDLDGISYTEKEFEYALSKNIQVIAFLHANPSSIPAGKTDGDTSSREKLEAFKSKVKSSRLVREFGNPDELASTISRSLIKVIKTYPAVGWVRASEFPNVSILNELNEAQKESKVLSQQLQGAQLEIESLKLAQTGPVGLKERIAAVTSEGLALDVSPTIGEIFQEVGNLLYTRPYEIKFRQAISEAIASLNSTNAQSISQGSVELAFSLMQRLNLFAYQPGLNRKYLCAITPVGNTVLMRLREHRRL